MKSNVMMVDADASKRMDEDALPNDVQPKKVEASSPSFDVRDLSNDLGNQADKGGFPPTQLEFPGGDLALLTGANETESKHDGEESDKFGHDTGHEEREGGEGRRLATHLE